jgi:predicted metal-dependent phosphoesterase TrpH
MKDAYADLHIHTIFSDGLLSPEEVVERAADIGLKAIGITDHDCIDGIEPTMKAAEHTGVEIIPGVEISASIGQREIHMLGYFIDRHLPELVKLLRNMRASRVERMRRMVELLQENGLYLDIDKVLGPVTHGTVGRLHLARAMKQEGLVRSMTEAFDRYIGNGKPCHVEHERLDYTKAIAMIKKAGGVPVLAHPATSIGEEYIPTFAEAGMRGIEVYHSDHRPAEEQRYLEIAEEYGLLVTGGSDCHGVERRGQILIGTVTVGRDTVEELRNESQKIREQNPNTPR